jgi:hypothetical protein
VAAGVFVTATAATAADEAGDIKKMVACAKLKFIISMNQQGLGRRLSLSMKGINSSR